MEQKRAQKQNHAYVVNKFAIKESSRCCWERTVSSVNGAGSTGEHTQKDETGPTGDMTHTCALRRFSRAWLCKAMAVARHAPLCMRFSKARILGCIAIAFSRGSFRPRDRTHGSCFTCTGSGFFTTGATFTVHKD